MKHFVILLFYIILLGGCVKQPLPSESIAESAITSTNALEQTLSDGCITDSVKTQIKAIKTQIKAITVASKNEKKAIEQEKIRWKWAFLGLLMVVMAFVARKLFERV